MARVPVLTSSNGVIGAPPILYGRASNYTLDHERPLSPEHYYDMFRFVARISHGLCWRGSGSRAHKPAAHARRTRLRQAENERGARAGARARAQFHDDERHGWRALAQTSHTPKHTPTNTHTETHTETHRRTYTHMRAQAHAHVHRYTRTRLRLCRRTHRNYYHDKFSRPFAQVSCWWF